MAGGRGGRGGRLGQRGGLAAAQGLALLNGGMATMAAGLAQRGAAAPTLQILVTYALLAAAFGTLRGLRRREPGGTPERARLGNPPWKYAAVGLVDLEANFALVKALQYTSITSAAILDCTCVVFAALLAALCLGYKFNWRHCAGVVVALLGAAALTLSDIRWDSDAGRNPLFGDLLALLGAFLYAVSNTSQEHLLRRAPPSEVLLMVGLAGTIFGSLQVLIVARGEIFDSRWDPANVALCAADGAAGFLFYSATPLVLESIGSSGFNLSLLATDLWAVLARVAFFGGFSGGLAVAGFLAALLLEACGVGLYAWGGDPWGGGGSKRYEPVAEQELEPGRGRGGGAGGGDGAGPGAEAAGC